MRQITLEEKSHLDRIFTYHPPFGNQVARYEELRAEFKSLAYVMCEKCPPTRERMIALWRLQEALMWSNASIAINEPLPTRSKQTDGQQG